MTDIFLVKKAYKIYREVDEDLQRQKMEGVNDTSNRTLSTKVDWKRTLQTISGLTVWGGMSFPLSRRGSIRLSYVIPGAEFMPMLDLSMCDIKSYIELANPYHVYQREGIRVWRKADPHIDQARAYDIWCMFVVSRRSEHIPDLTQRVILRIFVDRQRNLRGVFILRLVSHDPRGQEVVQWQFRFDKNMSVLLTGVM